eukprot:1317602-Rhodomonas_salina.3
MRVKGYLNEKTVLEIFAHRPRPFLLTGAIPLSSELCRALSKLYNISGKTVRAIWQRTCWAKVTEPYVEETQAVHQNNTPVVQVEIRTPELLIHIAAADDRISSLTTGIDEAFPDFSFEIDVPDVSLDVPHVSWDVTAPTVWLLDYLDMSSILLSVDPFDGDWLSSLTKINLQSTVPAVTTTEYVVGGRVTSTGKLEESQCFGWNNDRKVYSVEHWQDTVGLGVGEE